MRRCIGLLAMVAVWGCGGQPPVGSSTLATQSEKDCAAHSDAASCTGDTLNKCEWSDIKKVCFAENPSPTADQCGINKDAASCSADAVCLWIAGKSVCVYVGKPTPPDPCLLHQDKTSCAADTTNNCVYESTPKGNFCVGGSPPPPPPPCSKHQDAASCNADTLNKCTFDGKACVEQQPPPADPCYSIPDKATCIAKGCTFDAAKGLCAP